MIAARARRLFWIALALGASVLASPAYTATTIVLQNGLDGYSGCQDTYLDREEPSSAMGALEYLWQDGGDTDSTGARAMIRFDLSLIPATAHILSASLYLYADGFRAKWGSLGPTDCYFLPVTRPWSEVEATWQEAALAEPWNWTAGDSDDAPVCFFDQPVLRTDIDVWSHVDVTSFVQSWVDGSLPNYGMVGMTWGQGVGNYAHRFRSAQWPDPAFRPYLEIIYDDPGVIRLPPSYLDPLLRDRADLHFYQHLEDQPLDIALSDMVELGTRYAYTGYRVDLHDGEPVAAQLLAGPYLALDDEQVAAILDRGLIPVFRIRVDRNGGEATVQDVYEVAQWYAARYAGQVHWFNYHGEFNNDWYEYGSIDCSPEHVTARIVAAAQGVREVDPNNKMMLTQLGASSPYEYIEECLPYGLAEATDQWGYAQIIEYFWHERWYWPRYLRRWVILAAREAARVGHPISCQREGMIQVNESAPTHRVQATMVARKTVMDFVAGMVPSEWYKLYDPSPENCQIVADDLVTRYEAFYVVKNLNTYLDPGRWSGVYCGIAMDQPYQRFAFRDDDGSLIVALWDDGLPPSEDLVAPTLTQVTCLDYGHVYADLVDPMSGAVTPISFVSASGRLAFSDIPVVDYPRLLRLRHGVRGTVTDHATGLPVASARVEAWQGSTLMGAALSADDGSYAIPLGPGSYWLLCWKTGVGRESALVAIVPESSDVIDLSLGSSGPGSVTVGLYRPDTGTFYLRNSNSAGAADLTFRYGPAPSTWLPVAGDWDGDLDDTIALYNPVTGTFYLRNTNSAGAAELTFRYGPMASTWLPLVGDWDGDGDGTVGLYNPANGTFYLRNSNSAGAADLTFRYGPTASTWLPVVGDWDDNGSATIGLYNPANGTFYLRNSNSAGAANLTLRYGPAPSTWKPIAGDWNHDGTGTIGLYNPASGTFYLRNSNTAGAADLTFRYGPAPSTWKPITGDWDGM